MEAKKYKESDLQGLKFKTLRSNREFTITEIKLGSCWVTWPHNLTPVPYATHWVLRYLDRSDWIEQQ